MGKISSPSETKDVFQPGLIRGAERLSYAPHKRYFYVEHPTEGWRVYLRSAAFLYEAHVPFQKSRFLVVKRTGGDSDKKTWEPPKGQMEGKDAGKKNIPLKKLLEENVRREVAEEAKIYKLLNLRHTGMVLQGIEPDYPPNTYFQYHVFQAFVATEDIQEALGEFDWIKDHPLAFARFRSDKREKDALSWFDPKRTQMMGKWSPTLITMYLTQ
jgi:8-oxo-dGTP pyrophosphatase MutT (NUDIX family)